MEERKAMEGELVAAGWPAWLASVAGESIKGWLPRRADTFEKIDKIGQGAFSNVYKARDSITGKVVALKKVRFDNLEPESVRFMAREILLLRRLDHPNIIKLEGIITSRMSCSLYLVFEYMEHDLAELASHPDINFTESQVKSYMQQLLCGLDHCHGRGILHRDIKCANLLIDNSGILKIADFGTGTFCDPHQTQPLTSRVVTLWNRPPELILGATHYGPAVDLWSAGCILAELCTGKPVMCGRTEVEQLHKIFKLCGTPSEDYWRKSKLPLASIFKPREQYKRVVAETFKDLPLTALHLIETLLSFDPTGRGSAALALQNEFFTTNPLLFELSSSPMYPPRKELDVKLRDEGARRLEAARRTRHRSRAYSKMKITKETESDPAPDANVELVLSLKKIEAQPESSNRTRKLNSQGFHVEPPTQSQGLVGLNTEVPYQRKAGKNKLPSVSKMLISL